MTWGYEDRVNDDNIFIFRLDYPFRNFWIVFLKMFLHNLQIFPLGSFTLQ